MAWPVSHRVLLARARPKIWHVLTIRQRLALWHAGLLVLTLIVFSSMVYTTAQNQLLTAMNLDIRIRAQAIASALERAQHTSSPSGQPVLPTPVLTPIVSPSPQPTQAAGTPSPNVAATPIPTPNAATSAAIQEQLTWSVPQVLGRLDLGFEVLDSQGKPQYYAPSLNGASLPLNPQAIFQVLQGAPGMAYTAHAHQSLLDIYIEPITLTRPESPTASNTPSASPGTSAAASTIAPDTYIAGVVLVARPLDDVYGTLSTLSHLLLVGDLIALLLVSIGGWVIAKGGLSPLSAVTRTARAIANNAQTATLGTRVNYQGPRDEVGTLAATFNDMLAAIERVTSAQRRFVADASHELRAPITTIKGTLEFVLRRAPADLPAEERTAMLEDAYVEADRMASLINELLLLARVDAAAGSDGQREAWLDEQIRGRREPVEVDQVAMDVFRHSQALLHASRKDLRLSVTHLEPVSIMGDPGHIRQLALILLDNAIKYTPAGGKVTLSVKRSGERAQLSVTDTGIGIIADEQPHIFERFYRSDRARARDEHGSGLGLAIAKWIAESHDGAITVTSRPDQGSTFTVLLPEMPRPDDPVERATPGSRQPHASGVWSAGEAASERKGWHALPLPHRAHPPAQPSQSTPGTASPSARRSRRKRSGNRKSDGRAKASARH